MSDIRRLVPGPAVVFLSSLAACAVGDHSSPEEGSPSALTEAATVSGSIVGLGGKCLDVNDDSPADGAVVQLYSCNGTDAQRWSLVGTQLIGPGGKCLDATGQSSANGTRLQLWTCWGGANQQWSLVGGQLVGIGGQCADVSGASTVDRTPVQLWSCSGAANQQFSFGGAFPGFYGGNAHWDYDWTAEELAGHMHQEGMTVVRMDSGGFDPTKYGRIADFAEGLRAIDANLKIFVAITGSFDATQDEAANYATGYAGAQAVAKTLGAVGITDYECGNELLSDTRIFKVATLAGDEPDQYNGGAAWSALRGAIRGMIDGVKSVNGAYRTAVNFTIAQIAASDMLWNGETPEGASGAPTVRWDITSWHNYQVYGSPFSMGTNGHGNGFNLIEYVSKAYGKPIMITEWNANPEDDDQAKTAFTESWLQQAYANRARYHIESTMLYQLGGGTEDFGLFIFPDQTAAYAAFSAANLAR